MYSTPKLIAAAFAGVVAIAGCQKSNQAEPAALNPTPIIEDDAMKLRQWSASSASYPNGATVAGPTLFALEPRRGMPEYKYLYTDTGVFTGNLFLMPYRFCQTPPWREVIFPGEVVPPSFTAMPPILPEPEGVPLPPPAYNTAPVAPATQPN